jgi:ABC-2 type transport system permease protein
LGLAVLGGATLPLHTFKVISETVWQVAHISPHAWALEAYEELITADGGLTDIAGFLLILVVYAVVFFALAIWRLRVVLTR